MQLDIEDERGIKDGMQVTVAKEEVAWMQPTMKKVEGRKTIRIGDSSLWATQKIKKSKLKRKEIE